ncbi:MAG: zinc ABC transporter substrate-binding protein [Methanomassiliicoccus sp.]|nr:zinc ABC transporter substrate-binding protein [Methanomassiliicoccus sp.]
MNLTKRSRTIVAVALVAAIVLAGSAMVLSTARSPSSDKLQVVTSFYPLYYFSSQIGGDLVEASMLIPDNADPHSWEPTASDMVSVDKADVLVYNGAGFEPWIGTVLDAVNTSGMVVVDTSKNVSLMMSDEVREMYDAAVEAYNAGINATVTATADATAAPVVSASGYLKVDLAHLSDGYGGYVKVISAEGGDLRFFITDSANLTITDVNGTEVEYEMNNGAVSSYPMFNSSKFVELEAGEQYTFHFTSNTSASTGLISVAGVEESEGGEEHHHGLNDPHFWLDPMSAKVQVQNILAGFIKADPDHASVYQGNAANLTERLDKLNQDYVDGLANRTKGAIVTTHEGFNYLAARYGFKAYGATGISADSQPSAQDLANLVDLVRTLNLKYVYSEPIYSDSVINTIASETGTTVLVLDGVHGRTGVHANMDYFQIMYANLQALQTGLEVSS